jgi:acetoin utilization deacetylase AcuC-like enzyme
VKAFYTDTFVLPLPEHHRFPMRKYAMLRERVAQELSGTEELHVPHAATDEELLRVHTHNYLSRVQRGTLSAQEIRALGFPWSSALVQRSRRSNGATIEACRAALEDGMAANLAGGTHHAFSGHGEAYCVFNDSAVAARAMLAEGRVLQVMVIDCDVHQGNGSAAIFADDPAVFTFSIHGEKNYPSRKQESDLDIHLAEGTDDELYLEALDQGLQRTFDSMSADLAIYLAGADPFINDRYGSLAITKAGLRTRDRLVFDFCQQAAVPVAITMGGGYAKQVDDIVDIHFQTVREAARRVRTR